MKNTLVTIVTLAILYLVLAHHDSHGFQSLMALLFSGEHSIQLDNFWLEKRMVLIGLVVLILVVYYHSIYEQYRILLSIYRNSPINRYIPPLSPRRANYIYFQNKSSAFALWLIELCNMGVLNLFYDKSKGVWTVLRTNTSAKISDDDRKVCDILFREKNEKLLKDSFSKPDPDICLAGENYFRILTNNHKAFLSSGKNSLPAWLLLIALLIEIPLLNSLYETPGLLVIGLALICSTAFLVYAFIYQLQAFYNGNYLISLLVLIVPILIMVITHWGLTGISNESNYWYVFFYPDLVIALSMAISFAPRLPKEPFTLEQIIGYQKYLRDNDMVSENDLPWRIGLEVDADIFNRPWKYQANQLPDWLQSDESDHQKVMELLHTTFPAGVASAINGTAKHKHKSSLRMNKRL